MSDDIRARIAARAAQELRPGDVVNLGIGIPNLIPGFLGAGSQVFIHTENGLLGVGPRPGPDELDPDLIDAAKQPVTALPGAAYFDSAESFAMISGGHVDVAVLGALQVGAAGDIANWAVPGKDVLGVGGAMDLVVGARRVIVTMTATSSPSSGSATGGSCSRSSSAARRSRTSPASPPRPTRSRSSADARCGARSSSRPGYPAQANSR